MAKKSRHADLAAAAVARARNWGKPRRVRGIALPEPRWFAVHTRANAEVYAARKLREAGFDTFFAFDRVRRRRKRPGAANFIVEWIERPYFKRYIFACLRFSNDTIEGIERCYGVSSVVRRRLSGEPLEVANDDMDRLMDAALVRFDEPTTRAQHGYCLLMREIVLDVESELSLFLNKQGKRRISRKPLPDAKIA
jgi:transcription antitermination factor NusG